MMFATKGARSPRGDGAGKDDEGGIFQSEESWGVEHPRKNDWQSCRFG